MQKVKSLKFFISRFTFHLSLFLTILLFLSPPSYAAEKPEVFVQLGHSDSVNSVAISPDGKYALSGGGDKTLKLWAVKIDNEIRMGYFGYPKTAWRFL